MLKGLFELFSGREVLFENRKLKPKKKEQIKVVDLLWQNY